MHYSREGEMDPASGSDEGEIIESESEKATTSLPSVNGTTIDGHSRTRVPVSKPSEERESSVSYREKSPPRRDHSPRGEKRLHEDDDRHDHHRPDARRFRTHYDGRLREERRRSRVSYADLDYGGSANQPLRYDDRGGDDRYRDKRARTRSRSPVRAGRMDPRRARWDKGRTDDRRDSQGQRGGGVDRDYSSNRNNRMHPDSPRASRPPPSTSYRPANEAQTQDLRRSQPSIREVERGNNAKNSTEAAPGQQMSVDTEPEPVDEAALIEERRKKREAIKAKYRGQATPLLVQSLQLDNDSVSDSPSTPMVNDVQQPSVQPESPKASAAASPKDDAGLITPTDFSVAKDEDLANATVQTMGSLDQDGPSAADYNPTMDMREDQMRNDQRHHAEDMSSAAYVETHAAPAGLIPEPRSKVDHVPKKRDDLDMFAEDDEIDDMFAEPSTGSVTNKAQGAAQEAMMAPQPKELDMSMLDDWDDSDGYYRVILGELLDGRYHVQTNLGKGMFSGVVRAMDSKTKKLVAIKIIRSNETMKKAGMKEMEILQKLAQADPDDRKHIVRLERFFEHKGHLCMVFENLSINLREVLKKFGRDVGINLRAVRAYAQQIFLGLSLLRKCNLLHADLKPDNILVNEGRNHLKICDLGSASDASDNDITPYLVSRFYRAPEIILGLPYDFAIDTWSVGCTLYELYTGKILFTGPTNNQMLRSMMECRGKFSHKMLRRAQFAGVHFDDLLNFRSVERDKLTGKEVVRILPIHKPIRDLKSKLMHPAAAAAAATTTTSSGAGGGGRNGGGGGGVKEAELKELHLFADLLDRCLNLNPEKRCTPAEALRHPFLVGAGRR